MAQYVQLNELSPSFLHPTSIADTLRSHPESSSHDYDSTKAFGLQIDEAASDDKRKYAKTNSQRFSSSTLVSKLSRAQEKLDSDWTLESICIAISVICFIALAIIFAAFDGKPLDTWTFFFSLNTVASTLGTIGKSTLLLAVSAAIGQGKWLWFQDQERPLIHFDTFDEASRGPLGSLKLLWRTRASDIAALGAIVTLLSLAADPFLQSVIDNTGRLDHTRNSTGSRIARTERWHSGSIIPIGPTVHISTNDSNQYLTYQISPDFGIAASFYNGLLASDSISKEAPFFDCSSGNCTWPLYTSLAMCSQCNDVSSHVKRDYQPVGEGFLPDTDRGDFGVIQAEGTNYTLPRLFINNYSGVKYPPSGDFSEFIAELMTVTSTIDPAETISFQDLETMLTVVTIMRPGDEWLNNRTSWNYTKIVATECAVHLCVNSYSSTLAQGNMTEYIEGSWAMKVPRSYQDAAVQPYGISIKNFTAINDDDWNPPWKEYYINRTDFQLSLPADVMQSQLNGNATYYNVSQAALLSTLNFFEALFGSQQSSHDKAWREGADVMYSNSLVQPLWDSKDPEALKATFARIATSMTNRIRDTGELTQAGNLQQWTYHFDIRWPFFILPFGMSLLGCFFTVVMIGRNSRHGMPAWKTSLLASLAYGLDEKAKDDLRQVMPEKQREVARQTHVLLRERDDGVALTSRVSGDSPGSI